MSLASSTSAAYGSSRGAGDAPAAPPGGREPWQRYRRYHEPHPAVEHTHPRHTDPEFDARIAGEVRKLWVVTAISNPVRYKSRYALYKRFRHHVVEELGLGLVTVEAALGERDHQLTEDDREDLVVVDRSGRAPAVDVRVRNTSQVWLKENLWNIGARHLPNDCAYVLFADADITFANPHIATEVVHALQEFKVVQPFETAADMGPAGQIMAVHRSFGWCFAQGWEWRPRLDPCSGYYSAKRPDGVGCEGFGVPWHPGFAMAFRRDVLQKLQLLEVGVLGAGDHHMCGALIGRAHLTFPRGVHPGYKRAVLAWQARAAEVVRQSFGWVDGTILHGFHGAKANRKYVSRWDILVQHQFDPDTDVYRNAQGVLELEPAKPELRDAIRRYFRQRSEDDLAM